MSSCPRARHRLTVLLLVVAVGLTAAVVWRKGVRDHVVPRRLGEVVPGVLYRSAQIEGNLIDDVIDARGVRTVLNLGVFQGHRAYHDAELAVCAARGVEVEQYGLRGDGTGDPAAYVDVVARMKHARDAGEPLLVHCSAGVNRTGAAVALFRILIEHARPADALAEMERFGFDPADNTALIPYLNEHIDDIAHGLEARGVISALAGPLPQFPRAD